MTEGLLRASCTGPRALPYPSPAMTPPVFLVSFEHAQRSFQCVLLDWDAADRRSAKQWVVTVAGRTVWSFPAGDADTRASVQTEVARWWDAQKA
jgi:hypothetical protein